MKTILLSLIVALFFLGCKPIERIVYVEREVPVEVVSVKTDTLRLLEKDSIFVSKMNDTIRIERFSIRYRDRISIKIDTVPKIVTVETIIEKPIEKIIEKQRLGFFWWFGLVAVGLLFAYVVHKIGIFFKLWK